MYYGGSGVGITGSSMIFTPAVGGTPAVTTFGGDIDMQLNNIKNIGADGFSFNAGSLLLTFTGTSPLPAIQPIGSPYSYFVCKAGCTVTSPNTLTDVTYFALGGGGGGGYQGGGGGGAGGLKTNDSSLSGLTKSYISGLITLAPATTYTVGIGTGGKGAFTIGTRGATGGDTTFIGGSGGTAISITGPGGGGGGGGGTSGTLQNGGNGGCGGGGESTHISVGGTGSFGFDGGSGLPGVPAAAYVSGGGGGLGSIGGNGVQDTGGGSGGLSINYSVTGLDYGGGGGGNSFNGTVGSGGGAGAGAGGAGNASGVSASIANRGSGGGGGGNPSAVGGDGSSGVFILGVLTSQAYTSVPTQFGSIAINSDDNLVISATKNLVLSGVTGPTGYAAANVLNMNSTGVVSYNNYIRGTVTANGMTPVSVSNSLVQANSIVVLNRNSSSATSTLPAFVSSITPGTGFTIVNTVLDSSTYNYLIQ
jgi:hypothetical protein